MKAENKVLLVILVGIVVVVTPIAADILLTPYKPSTFLPLPTGTQFPAAASAAWAAHFTVGPMGGTLVGGWTAYNGTGRVTLAVVNGTVSKPTGYICPHLVWGWRESNGTVDVPLAPGPYTAYWTTGLCSSASEIVVTQPIQVVDG